MKFSVEYVTIKAWKLRFVEDFIQTDFNWDLPLLIDDQNNVLLGNSNYSKYDDLLQDVKCLIMKNDSYLQTALSKIEFEIITEDNQQRFYDIQKELKDYLSQFNNQFESFSLFDLPPVEELITEENYEDPGDYDYIKHNVVDRGKNDEEVEDAGLFSDFGEHEILE